MSIGELFPLCLIDRIIDKINIEKSLVEIEQFQREIEQSCALYRVYLNHPVLNLFTVVEIEYFKSDKKIECSVCFIAENVCNIKGMEKDIYDKFLSLLLDLYPDFLLALDKLTPYDIDLNLKKGMSAMISGSYVYTGYSKDGNLIFRINQYKHNQII